MNYRDKLIGHDELCSKQFVHFKLTVMEERHYDTTSKQIS